MATASLRSTRAYSSPSPYSPTQAQPMPAQPTQAVRRTMPRSADDLLASARRSLVEASIATTAGERYAAAHLAALRAAAAVLAAEGKPSRRARVRSVWVVLPQVAAEFSEWADFFAAGARKRAAAEAGLACVTHREADDLVREADTFVARVAAHLGVPYQSAWTSVLVHAG